MNKLSNVPFQQIDINMGFWQQRQQLNRDVTINAVMDQFMQTGRFDAFRCDWKEGAPKKPHFYWDSDIAKWMESVAYLMEKQPMPELEQAVESLIDEIERNQAEDGYFNIYFLCVDPAQRWQKRDNHELYCAGHLMEAAIAWKNATGRDRFLKLMCRYADYIDRVFRVEDSAAFVTPGHEEIELALVKLYHATCDEKYLNLSKFFIDQRGNNKKEAEPAIWARYRQHHLPCREQDTAEGHVVRACYLYSGMADLAYECDDEALQSACEKLFENVTMKRMYITGGVGSNSHGETFSDDFNLPNETAYTETCAAISLCYFAQRMLRLKNDRRYADVIERVLYNAFLSGVSLDGTEFFYTNPMEINMQRHTAYDNLCMHGWLPPKTRSKVFACSCCPPNLTRFIASLGDYLYTRDDENIYLHQYIGSAANIDGGKISIRTAYPADGDIAILAEGLAGKKLHLRIPGWCKSFTLDAPYEMADGYAVIDLAQCMELHLVLAMEPVLMEGNPAILDTFGKAALMRGPVVYCLEGVDHDGYLGNCCIKADTAFRAEDSNEYCVPVYRADGIRVAADRDWLYRPMQPVTEAQELRYIPYYAFANRGKTDLKVWLNVIQ